MKGSPKTCNYKFQTNKKYNVVFCFFVFTTLWFQAWKTTPCTPQFKQTPVKHESMAVNTHNTHMNLTPADRQRAQFHPVGALEWVLPHPAIWLGLWVVVSVAWVPPHPRNPPAPLVPFPTDPKVVGAGVELVTGWSPLLAPEPPGPAMPVWITPWPPWPLACPCTTPPCMPAPPWLVRPRGPQPPWPLKTAWAAASIAWFSCKAPRPRLPSPRLLP